MTAYLIKTRRHTNKTRAWWFVTETGKNRLRIHASPCPDLPAALRLLDQLIDENPAYEFRLIPPKGEPRENRLMRRAADAVRAARNGKPE